MRSLSFDQNHPKHERKRLLPARDVDYKKVFRNKIQTSRHAPKKMMLGRRYVLFGILVFSNNLHSLKLTAKAPENRPGPKEKRSYSKHQFSGTLAVSFREGYTVRGYFLYFSQESPSANGVD